METGTGARAHVLHASMCAMHACNACMHVGVVVAYLVHACMRVCRHACIDACVHVCAQWRA